MSRDAAISFEPEYVTLRLKRSADGNFERDGQGNYVYEPIETVRAVIRLVSPEIIPMNTAVELKV